VVPVAGEPGRLDAEPVKLQVEVRQGVEDRLDLAGGLPPADGADPDDGVV
jgi:hypothetical protein